MNILFDINHPADINFFKQTILKLSLTEHNIFITYRPRGKLKKIIKFELSNFETHEIGKHYQNFVMKILGQLYRDILMFSFQRSNDINLSICFGPTNAISSWLNNIPYLAFEDDYEYKIPFFHSNLYSTKHIMPDYIKFENSKTIKYNGFKELAYLHPNLFSGNIKYLDQYGLTENNYVFIRDISSISLNYTNKHDTTIFKIIDYVKQHNLKIVLSLEDNCLKKFFESDCLILNEPVSDIYSLMKYSKFVISSGDTMAREASILGVPSLYTGGRDMLMNTPLIRLGAMIKATSDIEIKNSIFNLSNSKSKQKISNLISFNIKNNWSDTTLIILKNINNYIS